MLAMVVPHTMCPRFFMVPEIRSHPWPGARSPVLPGESENQCFHFLGYRWSSGRSLAARAIEFVRHQFRMPTENSIRFDDRRNGHECLSSELLPDGGKVSSLFFFEPKSPVDIRS